MCATIFLAVLQAFPGTGLFGESYGADPTDRVGVLALHGWRRDHNDFSLLFREPSPLSAIAVDLPGFGGTPAPSDAWGSAEYAEALVPLLARMSTPAVVLGHSFGGRVAVHLAAAHPELVGALVLTGVPLFRPSGRRPRPPAAYRTARRLRRAGVLSEERMERFRQRYGSADYKAASGVMRDVLVRLLAEDYEEPLRALGCPVELVWGDVDSEAPLEVAERARETLGSSCKLTVVKGAGHMTPFTAPRELRAALRRCGAP